MKRQLATKRKAAEPQALAALKRAARAAVELARRTKTSAYVLIDGRIVDAAKPKPQKANRLGNRPATDGNG